MRIRFTGRNAFGVMDHRVDLGTGPEVHVPMRVVPNGAGAEVPVTPFRRLGMPDEALRGARGRRRVGAARPAGAESVNAG